MKKIISLVIVLVTFTLFTFAKSNKLTYYRTALTFAYSPANNVYEDENIRLEIYNERLWAINKTDRTIFIDLSQCFLNHNESSYPIFDKAQNEKQASKHNVSSSIDEFLSIAPAVGGKQNPTLICYLSGGNLHGTYSTSESMSDNFSIYEERLLNIINELVAESMAADPKGKKMVGTAYKHLLEDETISSIGANLAYAFNKRSENWTPISISTWVSDIYLVPYYVEMPKEISKKEKNGFGIKKTEAAKIYLKADSPFEFDDDKSPITVCDWEGNFKKGKFELSDTEIDPSKHKIKVIFDGQDAEWGRLYYLSTKILSKYNTSGE